MDLAAEIRAIVELPGPELHAAGLVPELALKARTTCRDGARLRQVVLALLENARRHASPGVLRISTARSDGAFVPSV